MFSRAYLRNYWLANKDRPVLNWAGVFIIMGQYISLICSPLSLKLVQKTRAQYIRPDDRLHKFLVFDDQYDYVSYILERSDISWFWHLLRPSQLLKCIKQYHCVGNGFFLAVAIQFAGLCYLFAKSMFHALFTGSDKAVAQYYADRYFPRVFHSYSDTQFLDVELLYFLFYIMSFRFARLYSLVKNSVINRNGYRQITAQQASFSSALALVLPLHDWKRFAYLLKDHKKDCAEDPKTRNKHISFADDIDRAIKERNLLELLYFHNPISFDGCYSALKTYCRAENRIPWAKDWYVPEPVIRLDPIEYGWLAVVALSGVPLALAIATSLIIGAPIYELYTAALESDEEGYLMIIIFFLFDPSRLVRVLDLIILVLIHLPPQIEGATFYWDCCIVISRAKKIDQALQDNIETCIRMPRSSICSSLSTVIAQEELNQAIYRHVKLLRCVCQEFSDLRRSHKFYMDILVIGGGLLVSIGVKEILISDSLFKVTMLSSYNIASCILLGLSVFFCILIENTVSMSQIRLF